MTVIRELSRSKKAFVFLFSTGLMAAVVFGGVDATLAQEFIDSLTTLALGYLAGQGAADLGRNVGDAIEKGRAAVKSAGFEEGESPDFEGAAKVDVTEVAAAVEKVMAERNTEPGL